MPAKTKVKVYCINRAAFKFIAKKVCLAIPLDYCPTVVDALI